MRSPTHTPAPAALPGRVSALGRHRFALLFLSLIALGMLARVPFVPRLGHAYDQDAYRVWMGAIEDHGLAQVFERTDTDYVGYHYILWALGRLYRGDASQVTIRDKELRVVLKLPGLLGDLLTTLLVGLVARSLVRGCPGALGDGWRRAAGRLRLSPADAAALLAAGLFLFHPAVLYASSYWGQQDSLVAFFMLLACWLAWRRQPAWAAAVLALGTIVKPQPLVLVPLLAWIVWRRSSWRGLLVAAATGAVLLALSHAYFIAAGSGRRVWEIYTFQLTTNEHLSFGAYNLWWPFERLSDARPETVAVTAGPLSVSFGLLASALVALALALAWWYMRRLDARTVLLGSGFWLAAYALVAAAAHERYGLPALAFLLAALPLTATLRVPLLLYTAALFANFLVALPLDRRWHQGDPLWLTLVVSGVAVVSVVWLGWVSIRPSPAAPMGTGVGPSPGPTGDRDSA